jgi:hypothetical protein
MTFGRVPVDDAIERLTSRNDIVTGTPARDIVCAFIPTVSLSTPRVVIQVLAAVSARHVSARRSVSIRTPVALAAAAHAFGTPASADIYTVGAAYTVAVYSTQKIILDMIERVYRIYRNEKINVYML